MGKVRGAAQQQGGARGPPRPRAHLPPFLDARCARCGCAHACGGRPLTHPTAAAPCQDYYEILGVPRGADEAELKKGAPAVGICIACNVSSFKNNSFAHLRAAQQLGFAAMTLWQGLTVN